MRTDIPDAGMEGAGREGRGAGPEFPAPAGVVFADGARTVAAHPDEGDFVTSWWVRFMPGAPLEVVLDALAEAEKNLEHSGHGLEREAFKKALWMVKKMSIAKNHYGGDKTFIGHIELYALGQEHQIPAFMVKDKDGKPRLDEAGNILTRKVRSQQDLADRWLMSKANVTKALEWFQRTCGIPERPDQRDKAARKSMEMARRKQLKTKKNV